MINFFKSLFQSNNKEVPQLGMQGLPVYVNLDAGSPAKIRRHAGRIATLLRFVEQTPDLPQERTGEAQFEVAERKKALLSVGVVLPETDSIEAYEAIVAELEGK